MVLIIKLENEYVDGRTGITYTLKGDYYFPNLSMSKDTNFILEDMEKIKKKFPKVRSFIKDDEIVEFTQEEMIDNCLHIC